MKKCTGCGERKEVTEYHKKGSGLKAQCKACVKTADRKYYLNNRDTIIEKNKRQSYEKGDSILERSKRHYYKNRDKILRRKREYYRENKSAFLQRNAKRRANKIQATPSWLTDEHKFMLNEIYELRHLRSKTTKVEHHVDHIVPLCGKDVCGLHVPWNLQVIPARDNLTKGNRR